ncbi:hypothetical protein ACQ4PT_035714 [Festuca glaucescens]
MDSGSTEIVVDAGCFRLYKDGHIDRLSGMDTVPAGFDADTGVTSKDVMIDAATGVSVRLYLPDVRAAESGDDKLGMDVELRQQGMKPQLDMDMVLQLDVELRQQEVELQVDG